jgi:hypothetical protein
MNSLNVDFDFIDYYYIEQNILLIIVSNNVEVEKHYCDWL